MTRDVPIPYRRRERPSEADTFHTDPGCPVGMKIHDPVPADPDADGFSRCAFCAGETYKASDPDYDARNALEEIDASEVPELNSGGSA